MIDWTAIKTEYEQGASQRDLAEKHGVSKSYVAKKCSAEGWQHKTPTAHSAHHEHVPFVPLAQLPDSSLATLASFGRAQLAQYAAGGLLSLKEHKAFAETLEKYARVEEALSKLPSQSPARDDQPDYSSLENNELEQLMTLMQLSAQRKREK